MQFSSDAVDNLFGHWKREVDLPCNDREDSDDSDSEDDDNDDDALYKRFVSHVKKGI